jgi:hypothetical protein
MAIENAHTGCALKLVLAATGLPVLLCAGLVAALLAQQVWLAGLSPRTIRRADFVRLCVSARVSGDLRLAAWWDSAVSGRTGEVRQPFVGPNMACALAPWHPWLPDVGGVETTD